MLTERVDGAGAVLTSWESQSEEQAAATAVVIGEDPIWGHAISWVVESMGIRLLGSARGLDGIPELLCRLEPDLIVIYTDIETDPQQLYRRVKRTRTVHPSLGIVVVCSPESSATCVAALAGGATRLVSKERAVDVIHAIRAARAIALDGTMLTLPLLTRRELEILRLVSSGHTNREVAELLWVTDQTVKFHLANVYRKLGVNSRGDAVRWAVMNGLAKEVDAALTAPRARSSA